MATVECGADGKAQPVWMPKGVTKSDSTRSAGERSTKSHMSVSVLGAHPLGTLRVHDPLAESPAEGDAASGGDNYDLVAALPRGQVYQSASNSSHESLPHSLGGGDVVLILDLPEVFTVGYDTVAFTAKHFGGVRDVPAGPHFFWVAHPDAASTRCGFWMVTSDQGRVHVLQWDKFNETLGQSVRAEARIQTENLDTFHAKLLPYRDPTAVPATGATGQITVEAAANNLRVWGQLTDRITKDLLDRVTGQRDGDWHVHTADRVKGAILIAAEIELDRAMSNPMFQDRELSFTFSQLSRTYTTDSIGADRTLDATDATSHLLSLVDDPSSKLTADDIVGEFQFAYVVGMLLGNDSCIQQWWHMLLKLILKAYLLPVRRPALAEALLRTLVAQLYYGTDWLDGSIMENGDSNGRELRLSLIIYKRRLEELFSDATTSSAVAAVSTTFAKVESILASYGWDLRAEYLRSGKVTLEDGEEVDLEVTDLQAEDERGEWAPEVVELDEDGRQRDLVSWTD